MGGTPVAGKHYSDDELIAKLYELGAEDGHLVECGKCNARWRQLLARREQLRAQLPLDESELARQRQAVLDAARQPARRRWAPYAIAAGASAAVVLAVSLSVPRPGGAPPPAKGTATLSDADLLADVYSLVYRPEPAALEPVRALFEEEP